MIPVPVNWECSSADSSQRLSENFLPNMLADEPLGSFGEGHLIREAAFEKHPNGRMVMHVGGRNQGNVLADSHVHQAAGFREDEDLAHERRLDFFQFPTKVLHKSVVQGLIARYRLLANEAETLIQLAQELRRDELTRIQSLLDFRLLSRFAEFLVDLMASFGAMPQIAQHDDEQVLRVFEWHLCCSP